MERKHITFIILILLIITAILFFIFSLNTLIGIIFLLLAVAVYISNNRRWGDKFQGELGIALFASLIISFTRDIFSGTLNQTLQIMYFVGLAVAVLLLMRGASKGEFI
jgi:hypothetical protein